MTIARPEPSAAASHTAPSGPGRERPPVDRLAVIWRAKLAIVVCALAVAVLVWGVCQIVPATYASTAVIEVTLPPSANLVAASAGTTAAGNLASAYAQTATLAPVLERAGRLAHTSPSVLHAAVSAGTINGENLISVRGEGPTPQTAMLRANATATALVQTISAENARATQNYSTQLGAQLGPINRQVRALTARLTQPGLSTAERSILETQLSTLLAQRGTVAATVAQTAASQATVAVFAPAGAGTQTAPRSTLYALAGFLAALLIGAQASVLWAQRRIERAEQADAERAAAERADG